MIEEVSLENPLDPWLSLPALRRVSGLSVRTLRALCCNPKIPLPHYRMTEPHVVVSKKTGMPHAVRGKILVRWSEFERCMEQFHHIPARGTYGPAQDVHRLVNEVVAEVQATPLPSCDSRTP